MPGIQHGQLSVLYYDAALMHTCRKILTKKAYVIPLSHFPPVHICLQGTVMFTAVKLECIPTNVVASYPKHMMTTSNMYNILFKMTDIFPVFKYTFALVMLSKGKSADKAISH
jgi:hypothetical protein